MAGISSHKIYAVKIRESADDGSDFGTPDADYRYLFLGEDGDLHLKDAGDAITDFPAGGGGGGAPSCYSAGLTSDVTLTTAGTEYTILTKSVPAGDYLLLITLCFQCNTANTSYIVARVTDGATTTYVELEDDIPNNNGQARNVHASKRITLTGTTTLTLLAVGGRNGDKIKANSPTGGRSTNVATQMQALAVTAA